MKQILYICRCIVTLIVALIFTTCADNTLDSSDDTLLTTEKVSMKLNISVDGFGAGTAESRAPPMATRKTLMLA